MHQALEGISSEPHRTQQALHKCPRAPVSSGPHRAAAGTLHPLGGVGTVKGAAQRGDPGSQAS